MKSPVYIEEGARRYFACSLDWPGLCRSGKSEEAALEALGLYVPRYAKVAARAGQTFGLNDGTRWEVVAKVPTRSGGADFGVPTTVLESDAQLLGKAEGRRSAAVLEASWDYLDDVVAEAPATLRKGPRGGGRDRDAIAAHVAAAEQMFAAKVGVKLPVPQPGDEATVKSNRAEVLRWCQDAAPGVHRAAVAQRVKDWPARYAIRRLTWHVLDHAWEIEDKS